jgi:ribonuclease Z
MIRTDVLPKGPFRRTKELAILGLFCLALTLPTRALSADDFSVTLLGTGTPSPIPERFGASTLVEAGGLRLVFDVGRGTTIRLWQKQIPLGAIDAHFLTHLHSDHINGLSDLWLTGWIQTPFGGRKKPFLIYGPSGTEKMMTALWDAFSEDRRIRIEDEKFPLAGLQTDAHDVRPGLVYERNGVVVTAFEVDHGDHVKPAYGYKVTYRGHSVVISGDTRYDKRLEEAARGADLLIQEVAMIPEKILAVSPVHRAINEHHISPELAGKLFAAARPKLAAYTHIILVGVPNITKAPTVEELLVATRKTYDGPVVAGVDLMTFKIDDSGVSVIEPPRQ